MKRVLTFFKKEVVLSIALLLSIVTAFIVPPSTAYIDYIDFRVLALLFCLMIVIAGLKKLGFFLSIGELLLSKVKSTRMLILTLVGLCFFSSMFITNDVALITFVPFAIMILNMAGQEKLMIAVVVLQTIAANLGSMLTPIGNPQNLYLYSSFGISFVEMLRIMLPLAGLALILLIICTYLMKNEKLSIKKNEDKHEHMGRLLLISYFALFTVCILCVLRVISWPVMLIIVALGMLILDRELFLKVDYNLLLTFVFFFIFIGNMKDIPVITDILSKLIDGREMFVGIVASQGISNVPATILLSGFTTKYKALLYGVNIGGLGTLIASLASVISYRQYAAVEGARKGKFIKVFTAYNLIFLAGLTALGFILL